MGQNDPMTSSTPSAPSDTPDQPAGGPADDVDQRPQARSRARGNWRSLVLSMAAVAAVVLVLYSIVPRPEAVDQPPVDVVPVAQQAQRDDGLTVWIPELGEPGRPWKATSVRYRASEQGPKAWYAGYHRTDDDTVFVAVQQIPASSEDSLEQAWVEAAVSGGTRRGTVDVAGTSWTSYATGGDPERRSLVGELGGLTTVVSGLADDRTLASVVGSLRPYQG